MRGISRFFRVSARVVLTEELTWASRLEEVPRGRRIAVHCAGGYRSSIAVSILHQYGITNLIEMAGGLSAWDAAKLPVISAV
jgi:rhodanese-related sulfurtransferase